MLESYVWNSTATRHDMDSMAERYLGGWTYGPIRDIKERISPYLSDWDDIPIEIQDYDRDFARIVPGVLSLAGLEIHR